MKNDDGTYRYDWKALFRPSFPHGPQGSKPLDPETVKERTESACPVKGGSKGTEYNVYSQPIDPTNNMPQVANQMPAPNQSQSLSTHRVSSTIPKGNAATTWTYPSPQMFYNALARKGKLGDTQESDMESVVALHNRMNESTWQQVVQWESLIGDATPKLLKFQGRPSDLSPKATLKHWLLGHPLPFDRHDWTILRADGTTMRYVIDYYYQDASHNQLLTDVRPALDGLSALWGRAITMPWALWNQSTNFEPLPLRPSASLQAEVQDSMQVWNQIQAAVRGEGPVEEASLTREEAQQLVQDFDSAIQACRSAQKRLDRASEEDLPKASMDLTLCLGQRLCTVQHDALKQALGANDDAKIGVALESISNCVGLKTQQYETAQR